MRSVLSWQVFALSAVIACFAVTPARASLIVLQQSDTLAGSLTALSNFYASQGELTNVLASAATVTAADLSGADLFVAWLPANSYTAGELSTFADYLSNGGRILFIGEWGGFSPNANAQINAAFSSLGSSMSIVGDTLDSGLHNATVGNGQVLAHELTIGVNTISYAAASGISGGEAFVVATNLVSAFGAAEFVGGGRIILIGDSNLVNNIVGNDNDRLFMNILNASVNGVVPEPSSLALLGMGAASLFGYRLRRRNRNEDQVA